ncbi:MAG: Gfo/Idh/MocA family oxidoreductase [Bacteroidota bacterium]
MANKDIIRWGIIGCGDVTEVKSGPAYQQTPGFALHAVMRRDEAKGRDYARRHGVPVYHSAAEDLIADPDIDAVYVATPPDSHLHYGLLVAAAGKPCCIEKPLSPSYAESLSIREAFVGAGVPLFVAYYRRTLPRFKQVKEWLDAGRIGTVRHLNWVLSWGPNALDLSGEPNWRTEARVAPGGYFDDLASHGLDLITHFLGKIDSVYGVSDNQQGLYSAKDAFAACWRHGSGATGAASWNFGSYGNEERVDIFGAEGRITFSVFNEAPVVLETAAGREVITIEHPPTVHLPHVRLMYRQLAGEAVVHPANGDTALHTSWVMDRILGKL